MANDLATLNAKLATALRDTTYEVWSSHEMDDLITWAVADLWPAISYEPLVTALADIAIVAGTYEYATTIRVIRRIDLFDSAGTYVGPLADGTWEPSGSTSSAFQVNETINDQYAGGDYRPVGYQQYNVSTNLIPDDLVRLVLAKARAEAYRRMGADRSQFKNWQARNQSQDMTINELVLLINEADSEAERMRRLHRTIHRPVPGRI
jgi:hypothetical protein